MNQAQMLGFSLALIILVSIAVFFSCAESGLMSVNRYRLRHKAKMRKRYAMRLMKLLKKPDRLMGAILIGSTFASIMTAALATLIAAHFWGDTGALIAAFLTFIILIIAEITPKTLAVIYADQVARWVSYPITIFVKVLYPAVWLANAFGNGLLKLLHIRVKKFSNEPLSREELRSLVYDATGKISRQYQSMLLNILDLNKLTVDDVMVPKHEIKGLDMAESWEKVYVKINRFQKNWLPVYEENINNLLGVIFLKDILRLVLTETTFDKNSLREFLHEPYFVPEGTSLYSQLGYFQQSKAKAAFIVDEYGEIQGLVTLNDILEEIIGDFAANVRVGKRIAIQPDGCYLVDGAMTIREFNRITEWDLPTHGPRTMNGLIVEYLEALPHIGTAVLISQHPIEIMQVKENRVKLAKVCPKIKTN